MQQHGQQDSAAEERRGGIAQDVIENLHALIEVVVKTIVNHPECVVVDVVPCSSRLIAELHTHPDDVGQVVGRNAYLISSLRSFIAAFQGKAGVHMDLDYITEGENKSRRNALGGTPRR
jgi:predicted RNA-binding protein YlqC (UPF0109 family)